MNVNNKIRVVIRRHLFLGLVELRSFGGFFVFLDKLSLELRDDPWNITPNPSSKPERGRRITSPVTVVVLAYYIAVRCCSPPQRESEELPGGPFYHRFCVRESVC